MSDKQTAESLSPATSDDNVFVLAGCLAVEDALTANRLRTRGLWPLLISAVAVVAVFTIVLIAVAVSSRPYSPQASTIILFVACLFPAILVAPYIWLRVRLRNFARRRFGMFAPTESVFSPAKIRMITETATSDVDWSHFRGFRANESVALLYMANSGNYLIVARRKLHTQNAWPGFLALIESKLPKV